MSNSYSNVFRHRTHNHGETALQLSLLLALTNGKHAPSAHQGVVMEQNWVVPVGHDVGQWSLSLPLAGETISCLGTYKLQSLFGSKQADKEPAASSPPLMSLCQLKPLRCSPLLCSNGKCMVVSKTHTSHCVWITVKAAQHT